VTTYGPFTPGGWTSADQVCCSTSSFNAVVVASEGGYIDDTDVSTYSVAIRFAVDTTGMTSFTSASLVLTRSPNAYGNGGTNGVISIRLEDSTSSAAFSSGDNPYSRTFRTAEVEYDFPNDNTTVTIDLSAIFSDFYTAKGAGAHTVTMMFGALQRGWVASSVSYRCVTCSQTGGTLPSLTIVGSSGGGGGGDIVGSCAIGVSSSGTVSALGAIVAGATLGLALAGAITGPAAMSSSSTIGVTSVGTERGTGALVGAGSAGISTSGSLKGAGSIGGSATIGLVSAGQFDAGGMTASATIGCVCSGTLSASGALAGGASVGIQNASTASSVGGTPGTIYPTLSDYFTHTIPNRPRTIMFWAWDLNDDYDYLWMSGADYFYRDIVFDSGDPRFGEPGWLIFEKNQGAQRIYIERRYWGRWCAAIVYRANGNTDVYYGREGGEMELVGTTTGTTGDATEWWFGMFEGVIGWSGGTEYLYIDNTEWDLTRIRAQFRQRNPTAALWGFYPLENGSGNAETYGANMTRNGNPAADSQGVQFPILLNGTIPITVQLSGVLTGYGTLIGATVMGVSAVSSATGIGGVSSALSIGVVTTSTLSAVGSLTGAATCSVSSASTASGSGAIVGVATCAIANSATASGIGSVTGSSTIGASSGGEFPLPAGYVAGASSIALSCSGSITATAQMVGQCLAGISGASSGSGIASLGGGMSLATASVGATSGIASLVGTSTISLAMEGSSSGSGFISGNAAIQASASGELPLPAGFGWGNCAIQMVCEGALTGTGAISGTTSIAINSASTLSVGGYTRPFIGVMTIGNYYSGSTTINGRKR
jgi:hypothetical protein